jgi:hypothetical protein
MYIILKQTLKVINPNQSKSKKNPLKGVISVRGVFG